MTKKRLLCLGLVFGMIISHVQAAEIHVSPCGHDANPGTADKPLATVAVAQLTARAAVAKGPVTVRLHKGTYYLPDSIRFTAEDSGCTYAAVTGEAVVISGGQKLDLKWEPYRDGIMQAATLNGPQIDVLFVNGKRQVQARYPNYDAKARPFNGSSADAISPERAARWKDPAGGYLHSLHRKAWGGTHYRITGKNENGDLTYEGGWQNNRGNAFHDKARFVENIYEELDEPGEWYHDPKAAKLYYYPPKGLDVKQATVESARLKHLVEFNGTKEKPVKNVTLRGLIFRHTVRTFMETKEPLLRSDWRIYRGGAVLFNGSEDCTVSDCEFDQLGGNAIFVNNYNRRITFRGCDIHDTGGSAVAFVGDPKAVRNPLFSYGDGNSYGKIDKERGPKTDNYPGDCLVDDCLIRGVGTVEKQTAGVQMSMSFGITVRHCSIYDCTRAGINISEGTFGGHIIEFCDVFDTVLETGDHGSFNSWGRDRYWERNRPVDNPELSLLDMVKPNIIRNSRWRCDHGWDVDLDDGSSNYEIYNNLLLNRGLKLREGFNRKVRNNITVNNSLNPHVWYQNSGDEIRNNIWMGSYRLAGMPPGKWGKEVDYNLFTTSDADRTKFAKNGCDANSLVGDPQFIDPAKGDFRVKDTSPALKVGFVNFPMNQFGVSSPRLRVLARTPLIGAAVKSSGKESAKASQVTQWRGAELGELQEGEFSVVGVAADDCGVFVVEVKKDSSAFKDGMRKADFIQSVNGRAVGTAKEFLDAIGKAGKGKTVKLSGIRAQEPIEYKVQDGVQGK